MKARPITLMLIALLLTPIVSAHITGLTAGEQLEWDPSGFPSIRGDTINENCDLATTVSFIVPANTRRLMLLHVQDLNPSSNPRIVVQSSDTGPSSGFGNRLFLDADSAGGHGEDPVSYSSLGGQLPTTGGDGDFHWMGQQNANATNETNTIYGYIEFVGDSTAAYWVRFQSSAFGTGPDPSWMVGATGPGGPNDLGGLQLATPCPAGNFVSHIIDLTNVTEPPPPPPPPPPRNNLTGPDGAIYGGSRAEFAALIGISENAVDAFYSLIFILLGTALGYMLSAGQPIGAALGAVLGVGLSIGFGVLPAWVVALFGIGGTAVYMLLSRRGG